MKEIALAFLLWVVITLAVMVPIHLAYRAYWLEWSEYDFYFRCYLGIEVVVLMVFFLCRCACRYDQFWFYAK